MNRQEYIQIINSMGGKKPPCVLCDIESYNECKEYNTDCMAFREYYSYNKEDEEPITKTTKQSKLGLFKRPFYNRREDNERLCDVAASDFV